MRELRVGAVALARMPVALRLVGADTVGSIAYGALTVLLLLVGQRLGVGDGGFGYLVGSLVAAPLVTVLGLSGALVSLGGAVAAYAGLCCRRVAEPTVPSIGVRQYAERCEP